MPRRIPFRLWAVLAVLLLAVGGGCERTESQAPATQPATAAQAPGQQAQPAAPGGDEPPVILMLGDSLTAGFGLPTEAAFPSVLQEQVAQAGFPHRVVNAGVSGDTSAGGRSRLDWLLRQRVDVMVLALGANDGLRGQDPEAMRRNLADIIERARARGIQVVLAGMEMPENYGADYRRRFKAVFGELAERYDLPFIPFLLEGVAMRPGLNQADGIHPNAEGARKVAENVWAVLRPLLERSGGESGRDRRQ